LFPSFILFVNGKWAQGIVGGVCGVAGVKLATLDLWKGRTSSSLLLRLWRFPL